MVVTVIGLAIVVIAAIYISWPLLAGAGTDDTAAPSEASALEREKDAALEAIREIDFDLRVGKISEEDHGALRADLEKRAMRALAALDNGSADKVDPPDLRSIAGKGAGSGRSDAGGFCSSCGRPYKADARFCPGCGTKLPSGGRSRKKRRAGEA